MPCLIGDSVKDLVRLFPPIPQLTTPGWLVTTDSARQQPHVRAMIDYLVGYIASQWRQEATPYPNVRAA
jgi:DNA-binding transcriptional LysR family regulator